jgi:hypothetical protein
MSDKKKIPCGNPTCDQRRIHHERQDEMRPHQMVEVDANYNGKAFCSITCACYAGYFHVTKGWIKNPEVD